MGGEDFKAKEGLIIISIVIQKGGVGKTNSRNGCKGAT
jgi:hypothetical protein